MPVGQPMQLLNKTRQSFTFIEKISSQKRVQVRGIIAKSILSIPLTETGSRKKKKKQLDLMRGGTVSCLLLQRKSFYQLILIGIRKSEESWYCSKDFKHIPMWKNQERTGRQNKMQQILANISHEFDLSIGGHVVCSSKQNVYTHL